MLKLTFGALLVAASSGVGQPRPPEVRLVLTHAEAQGLSRDPSAVIADPAAVAALAAFVAPLQQHAPPDPGGGEIGRLLNALPDSLMMPVQVSGVLLWVPVSTDLPDEAVPPGADEGSELAWDRYITDGEPLPDAEAVCPPDGAGYHVWTVAGVGPVEGCVGTGE